MERALNVTAHPSTASSQFHIMFDVALLPLNSKGLSDEWGGTSAATHLETIVPHRTIVMKLGAAR